MSMLVSPPTTGDQTPPHCTSFLNYGSLIPGLGQRASNRRLKCLLMGTASSQSIIPWDLTTYTAFHPPLPLTPKTRVISMMRMPWSPNLYSPRIIPISIGSTEAKTRRVMSRTHSTTISSRLTLLKTATRSRRASTPDRGRMIIPPTRRNRDPAHPSHMAQPLLTQHKQAPNLALTTSSRTFLRMVVALLCD